jgi:hypothetical protein
MVLRTEAYRQGGSGALKISRGDYSFAAGAALAPSVVMSLRGGHLKSSARPVVGAIASPVRNTRVMVGSAAPDNLSGDPPSKSFSPPLDIVSGTTGPASVEQAH